MNSKDGQKISPHPLLARTGPIFLLLVLMVLFAVLIFKSSHLSSWALHQIHGPQSSNLRVTSNIILTPNWKAFLSHRHEFLASIGILQRRNRFCIEQIKQIGANKHEKRTNFDAKVTGSNNFCKFWGNKWGQNCVLILALTSSVWSYSSSSSPHEDALPVPATRAHTSWEPHWGEDSSRNHSFLMRLPISAPA